MTKEKLTVTIDPSIKQVLEKEGNKSALINTLLKRELSRRELAASKNKTGIRIRNGDLLSKAQMRCKNCKEELHHGDPVYHYRPLCFTLCKPCVYRCNLSRFPTMGNPWPTFEKLMFVES